MQRHQDQVIMKGAQPLYVSDVYGFTPISCFPYDPRPTLHDHVLYGHLRMSFAAVDLSYFFFSLRWRGGGGLDRLS